jgi:hypothetical protein
VFPVIFAALLDFVDRFAKRSGRCKRVAYSYSDN